MQAVKITVPGRPVPKGRPRLGVRGRKAFIYTPPETREFEETVRVYAVKHKVKKQNGDLAAIATFYTGGQGDVDNLLKSLMDGLNGVAWEDDRQVKVVIGVKLNCPKGQERTEVIIARADEVMPLLKKVAI